MYTETINHRQTYNHHQHPKSELRTAMDW